MPVAVHTRAGAASTRAANTLAAPDIPVLAAPDNLVVLDDLVVLDKLVVLDNLVLAALDNLVVLDIPVEVVLETLVEVVLDSLAEAGPPTGTAAGEAHSDTEVVGTGVSAAAQSPGNQLLPASNSHSSASVPSFSVPVAPQTLALRSSPEPRPASGSSSSPHAPLPPGA